MRCGAITYEVRVPAADGMGLSRRVGEEVSFETLHYLEGQGQGSSFVPRLIGFQTASDRAFFELFTTVKGLGMRKALRALQLPFGSVARAILEKDAELLRSLPEIGKKMSETILVELSDKVSRFVEEDARIAGAGGELKETPTMVRDAVLVLTQLGEAKITARELVDRVVAADKTIESAEELVAAAFRLKEG